MDENKVVKIRKEFMNNATIKALSKKFKASERTLTDVKNMKTWKHVFVRGYKAWLEKEQNK
ncbi:hypothetical protein BCJMU10_0374 [Bacillus cereus]|nr:hypothetical protein BCJMU10_0374 [Bacillus cereus]BCC74683.1 hypothetical protein BCJMU62_0374 [Bacillus cereus]